MNEGYTYRTFVDLRWAEARAKLAEHVPGYVREVEAYIALYGVLELPDSPLLTKYSLPATWISLLESTMHFLFTLRNLQRTSSFLKPESSRTDAQWYYDAWVQNAYNLLESTKVLITRTCRVHGLGRAIKDKHLAKLDSPSLRSTIDKLRHPVVHGAGECGTIVHRAITDKPEEHSWEYYVVLGAGLIDPWLEHESSEGMTAIEWRTGLAGSTSGLVGKIEGVMKDLDRDIRGAA